MTKDEILDGINSIAKNMQDNDIWRWELIKIITRQREGFLTAETARKAIADLVHYHYTHLQAMDEFRSNRGEDDD
jgi:hypothetical protein